MEYETLTPSGTQFGLLCPYSGPLGDCPHPISATGAMGPREEPRMQGYAAHRPPQGASNEQSLPLKGVQSNSSSLCGLSLPFSGEVSASWSLGPVLNIELR